MKSQEVSWSSVHRYVRYPGQIAVLNISRSVPIFHSLFMYTVATNACLTGGMDTEIADTV